MSLADNIAMQLVEALANCTPENVKKIAEAKADALKLTDVEQKKRDEYSATINTANMKLDELKKVSDRHDLKRAELDNNSKQLDERKKLLDAREQRHADSVASFNSKQIEAAEKEKKLSNWEAQLEVTAKSQKATEERLKAWEFDLAEQASGFEQALLIRKKK